MMKTLRGLTLAVVASFAVYIWLRQPALPEWQGHAVGGAPVQSEIQPAESFTHIGFQLTPRATYDIEGLVLGTERYWFDPGADLAPIDLALSWREASGRGVLQDLRISQTLRFVYLRWDRPLQIRDRTLFDNLANMHLIPSSRRVWWQLKGLKRWSVVRLQGVLVDAVGPDGFTWRTSLSRTDNGAGACELMWVDRVDVLARRPGYPNDGD